MGGLGQPSGRETDGKGGGGALCFSPRRKTNSGWTNLQLQKTPRAEMKTKISHCPRVQMKKFPT